MESRILSVSEWPLVEPVVREVFHDGMPVDAQQTMFLATLDNGKLAAFVRMERLIHFVCMYVAPEYKGIAGETITRATTLIPPGFSAIWLTDRNRDKLAHRLGARSIGEWTVYRKDNI